MVPSSIKILAQSVPAKSDPANSDPAPSVPAKSVLAKSVPAKSVPAKSVPAPSVPAQSDSAIYEYLTKAVTTLSFSDTGDFKKDCLENHNILRHLMGRTTLVWDDKLANQAQIYSKDLANRNAFEHSNKSLKPFGKLGENLYKITNGQFSPKVGILAWFNEYPLYGIGTKIGSDPVAFKEYGHFTQMQYPTLTKVGCGVAFKNKSHIFTCNYDAVQISGEILVMSIPSPRPFGL
jgi:uncharacterized protein YkwD